MAAILSSSQCVLLLPDISLHLSQTTMATSQDKAFRRISELKEQIQLDQLAKRDLEQNYNLMLDEREELVKVLQTQVSYQKWFLLRYF